MENATAISWAGLSENLPDKSLEGLFKLNWAKTTSDFIESIKALDGVTGAFTFATSTGDIGFWASGKIPIRRSIKDSLYVRDGSLPENDWQGFYPPEENPHIINPKSGYIVSCNNRINPSSIAFHGIGSTVPSTARALRATKLIQMLFNKVQGLATENMKVMQNDVADLFAYEVTEKLVAIVNRYKDRYYPLGSSERKDLDKIMEIMPRWTGEMKADSQYALIYSMWYDELYGMMLHKQFPDKYERKSITKNFFSDYFLGNMVASWADGEDINSEYCENEMNQNTVRKCVYNVMNSALAAYEKIREKYGKDEKNWKWGYENMVEHPHVPFSEQFLLKLLFHYTFPAPGNKNTLFMNRRHYVKEGEETSFGPIFRMVASMKDIEETYLMGDMGQSGIILNEHYDSMVGEMERENYLKFTKNPEGRKLDLSKQSTA